MRLSLGFSSCPNDTFVFDAMIHGKVDTEGLSFAPVIADVEELNKRAFTALSDITKISYHAYPYIADNYVLLNSGSALGRGNGPLLISRRMYSDSEITQIRIAIPGRLTTANLLFSIFYPDATNKTEMIFSDIENAILEGRADTGVIIHESRFTYQSKGLMKIADLGEKWEKFSGQPIPLGGIVARRSLGEEVLNKIDRVLGRSVEFAFSNPESSRDYVKLHSQELDDQVINQHIELYVNRFTVALGNEGRLAVSKLYSKAMEAGILPEMPDRIFLQTNEN